MFRLESISPLVVAWAVSLGFGGWLLAMFLSGDPPQDRPPIETPLVVDRQAPAAAVATDVDATRVPPAVPEVKTVREDPSTEKSVTEIVPSVASPKKVAGDTKPAQPNPSTGPPAPPVVATPKPQAAAAATPAPRPAREIEEALKLPILRYVHQKPVAVSVVIREIEQLGGVDVRLDKGLAGDRRLERSVQLDLEKTTAGGILDAVLAMVGLTRRVHDGYVLVVLPVNGADPRGTR